MSARGFKPYAAYKESGVEWLGEIPAHWEVKRLKRIFRVANGSTPASEEPAYWDGKIPWVTPEDLGDLSGRVIAETRRSITELGYRSCGTTLVPCGSLLLSTRAPIGHVALAGVDLCTNQGCRSLVFRRTASREFFYYQLLAARPELESLGQGSTFRELAKGMLEDVELAEPPEPEQRAIAAFLDRGTARIDMLVAKNKRLIELLQERRTALITRAVTKGLDPSVAMKNSGVDWLGGIPKHWEIRRLRHLGDAIIGLTYEPADVVGPADEGVLVLRASNVFGGRVTFDNNNVFVKRVIPDRLRTRLGDILVCSRSGSRDLIGKNAKIDAAAVGLTFGAFMTVFRSPSNPFLFYVFNSALFEYQSGTFLTSTINQLTVGNLKDLTVPVPPHQEQILITAFLNRETAKIDALITTIRGAIDRLTQFRTALISAAVTGKIDLGEEAA